MSVSSLPSDYQLSNCIALYMRQQFFSEAFLEEYHQTPTPFNLHTDTTISICSIVSTMVDAYHNPGPDRNPVQSNVDLIRLEESVSRNESRLDLEQEDQFLITYPPNALGVLDCPTVILGWDDVIALWYLPNALSWSTKTWFDTLDISKDLNRDASLEWLQAMAVPNAMISGVLSIIHPPLYKAGIECIEKLKTETALNNPVMVRALAV
ncbi:hypothetical protein EDC04DRAFT_2605147 [Pisolithus marmoratus]|nr:hypothetical protein EDC04DRAFT_2605147 [Pisolithus marmoratus]